VNSVIELRYRLPADFTGPEETLEGFAQTNGIFHAWPYARELVTNTISRMRLPAITLPLFKPSEQFEKEESADPPGELDGPAVTAQIERMDDGATTGPDAGKSKGGRMHQAK
jgi:hypothetical protein